MEQVLGTPALLPPVTIRALLPTVADCNLAESRSRILRGRVPGFGVPLLGRLADGSIPAEVAEDLEDVVVTRMFPWVVLPRFQSELALIAHDSQPSSSPARPDRVGTWRRHGRRDERCSRERASREANGAAAAVSQHG